MRHDDALSALVCPSCSKPLQPTFGGSGGICMDADCVDSRNKIEKKEAAHG